MKTTQHTPGPWTCKPFLTPERDDDPMGVYAVEPVRTKLEAAYESDALIEKGFIDLDAVHAENQANARLIAAAPELLEACKDALVLIGHSDHCPSRQHTMAECLCIRSVLQAAIAKAGQEKEQP